MKKTLVAIAAVAAVTGAMAEATITGSIQAGTNSTSTVAAGAAAVNTLTMEDSNGNTVFNIGVSEDLGDGMTFKGNIAVEMGLSSQSFGAAGVNETYASLTGAFGGIKLGALQTPQFQAIAAGDASGLLISSIFYDNNTHQGSTGGSQILLQTKSFQYTLPTFVDGLSLEYQTGLGAQSDNTSDAQNFSVDYKAGALAAGIAYSTYKQTSSTSDTATTYYASYNLGPATLKGMWGNAQTSGAATVNSTSFGVVVPMGAATFMYNHGSSDGRVYNTASTAASLVSSVDHAADFVGVSYALSKRTTAYALYYRETGNNASVTSFATNSSWNTTHIMVIHAF